MSAISLMKGMVVMFKLLCSLLSGFGFRFVSDSLPTMEGVCVFVHDALSDQVYKIGSFKEFAVVVVPPGREIRSHVHDGTAAMIPFFGEAMTLDGEPARFGTIIRFEAGKPHGFCNVGPNGLAFISLNEGISVGRERPDVQTV